LTPEVEGAIAALEGLRAKITPGAPLAQNPCKELAHWLHGYLPLVCGAGLLGPVARRWKGQINEVSNAWAFFDELPEMDHNTVAGTTHPAGLAARVRAVFLTSDQDHPRNRHRQEITLGLFEDAGTACRTVAASGDSPLAQVLSAVLLGDATSCYLAMLYGADPTLIPPILALKEAMARISPRGE
jgi:glucose/mannose-6-phosphate isomerase